MVECIGFEFKFSLNSNSFECVWKRKEERKLEIEKEDPNPAQTFFPSPACAHTPIRPKRQQPNPGSPNLAAQFLSPRPSSPAAHLSFPPARPARPNTAHLAQQMPRSHAASTRAAPASLSGRPAPPVGPFSLLPHPPLMHRSPPVILAVTLARVPNGPHAEILVPPL